MILILACLPSACASQARGVIETDDARMDRAPRSLSSAGAADAENGSPARGPKASAHGAVMPPSIEPPFSAGRPGAAPGGGKMPRGDKSPLPNTAVADAGAPVPYGAVAPAAAPPPLSGPAPRGDGSPVAGAVFAISGGGAEEAHPDAPPMSGVDKDEISKLLKNRLDIGAYRVQMSATREFSTIVFDKSFDAMTDINLYEEFRRSRIRADRDAYWVRLAFIDLIAVETPFTEPRLYGLDKKRRPE